MWSRAWAFLRDEANRALIGSNRRGRCGCGRWALGCFHLLRRPFQATGVIPNNRGAQWECDWAWTQCHFQ
jgi:hypothetical protein